MLLSLAVLFALSARPSRVEAISPIPPTPVVAADGKRVLAYELHITNFDPKPLVLEHVDVNGVDYSGDTLKKMLKPICESADAARIEPGCRVIVFFWIALPLDAPVPASLRHRLVFDTSKIDDIVVPVRHGIVPLLSPFSSGQWYAGNGPSNDSDHRRSVIALGGRATIAQRFAIDWAKIGTNGNTFHDSRERNENFWGFGEPVQAVADGEVTEVVDEFPDNHPDVLPDPITPENIVGNHVILRIAPDVYVAFCHLQSHSVRVRLHEKVKRGEVIGKVGNSGQSTAAHLHLQVMNANAVVTAEGIPYLFDRFHFLGYGKDFEEAKHADVPRRNEMPVNDDVVSFP